MSNFTIANKIEVANPHANLDVLYGPYQDLLEAKSSVLPVLREKGLTVGVYESGAVVEYWWKAGTTDAHLVLKQASVEGAMLESEYTGETGTKQVNYAKSADEAEQAIHSYSAQQDALGREIHTTYALKQSGVTPPETARVILDDVTPTYTIVALTAENLIVENNATTGGEVIAPVLAADKTLKISIIGNDTLLDGTSYADGVTIFAIYEASTETWTLTSILDPEIPDYSDMTVDVMVENPTITPKPGYIRITGSPWMLGTMVFLRTTDTPTPIGIYRCVGSGVGYSTLKLIAAGTALHTVRVKDGDVWYSQYDGKNSETLVFDSIANKPDYFISSTPPTTNRIGTKWFDTGTGVEFTRLYLVDNYVWVDLNSIDLSSKSDKLIDYQEITESIVLNDNMSDKWIDCNAIIGNTIIITVPNTLTDKKQFFIFRKGDGDVLISPGEGMQALSMKLNLSEKYSSCQISIQNGFFKVIGDCI